MLNSSIFPFGRYYRRLYSNEMVIYSVCMREFPIKFVFDFINDNDTF